jgi:CRISPR-associated protein Cmr2
MDKIINKIYEQVLNDLKDKDDILADTRIPFITLYDHQILTSGIAVAITKELLIRGKKPKDISGVDITEKELITVVRAASLLHDWGRDDEKAYKDHRDRSIEWSKKFFKESAIEEPYFSLIISAIERHQLSYNPRTQLEKIICLADYLASAGDISKITEKKDELTEFENFRHRIFELYIEIFDNKKGLVLVLGDVDAVKSYVLETSKLPEIRGGSEILNELNIAGLKEIFSEELSEECLIYNGGGSFLAIVSESLANDLIEKVHKAYLRETKIATITCVNSAPLGCYEFERGLKPYSGKDVKKLQGEGIGNWLLESHFGKDRANWHEKKNFAELVSNLSAELRKKKASREYMPFFEALPIGRRCQSCGKRMASKKTGDKTREEVWCEVCYIKRERGEKWRFLVQFAGWLNKQENLEGMENILIPRAPMDLEDLTEAHEGYMAFIYADGNDIGSLLEKANSPAHYSHIAEELHKGTKDAVFGAVFDVVGIKGLEKFDKLPFEIINIGGDDITLIIAAPLAFEFSKRFLERFENNMGKLGEELELNGKITSSLGMVICKKDYPVYYAEKIAESLLKDAKKKGKKENESSLSYLYHTTSLAAEDGKEIIRDVYENEDKRIRLTMRPYSLSEFNFILQISGEIKKIFSNTQRNAISLALSTGKIQSENFLFYQIGRMDDNKMKNALKILEKLSIQFEEKTKNYRLNTHKIWFRDTEGEYAIPIYATPILDIIEIIKIARGEIDV